MTFSMLKAALAVLPSLALSAPSGRYGGSNSDAESCTPSVDLSNGTYHGVINKHYNQEFFLGIPYAQPPTGSLRFAPPKPVDESWDEPRDASEYGNICYGYGADTAALDNPISEDCLTLNIVRPAGTQPGDDLPVGIWVHGGVSHPTSPTFMECKSAYMCISMAAACEKIG
jgi:acetylcholinesterase